MKNVERGGRLCRTSFFLLLTSARPFVTFVTEVRVRSVYRKSPCKVGNRSYFCIPAPCFEPVAPPLGLTHMSKPARVALWDVPAAEFQSWRELTCSSHVPTHAAYLKLLADAENSLKRHGLSVVRTRISVAEMVQELKAHDWANTPENRAAVTEFLASTCPVPRKPDRPKLQPRRRLEIGELCCRWELVAEHPGD